MCRNMSMLRCILHATHTSCCLHPAPLTPPPPSGEAWTISNYYTKKANRRTEPGTGEVVQDIAESALFTQDVKLQLAVQASAWAGAWEWQWGRDGRVHCSAALSAAGNCWGGGVE